MHVDSVNSGIVLDHITAGRAMAVYRFLNLEDYDCPVAIIKNVRSKRRGKKDIIKIDAPVDVNLDVLGYIDPGITVNIVRDGRIVEKKQLSLPKRLVDVIACHNPRCVTRTEPGAIQIFDLSNPDARLYRCHYCEAPYEEK